MPERGLRQAGHHSRDQSVSQEPRWKRGQTPESNISGCSGIGKGVTAAPHPPTGRPGRSLQIPFLVLAPLMLRSEFSSHTFTCPVTGRVPHGQLLEPHTSYWSPVSLGTHLLPRGCRACSRQGGNSARSHAHLAQPTGIHWRVTVSPHHAHCAKLHDPALLPGQIPPCSPTPQP